MEKLNHCYVPPQSYWIINASWIELEPVIDNDLVKDIMFKLSCRVHYKEEQQNEL